MKSHWYLGISCACVAVLTAGCSIVVKPTTSASSESTSTEMIGYHKDTNRNYGTTTYDIEAGIGGSAVPTLGTVNLLVCPIEFTDFPFQKGDMELIRKAVSGTPEETNYWESLQSYYDKSSYGQLDMQFTYADVTNMGMTSGEFYSAYRGDGNYGGTAMSKAVNQYKRDHGQNSTKKFDNDGDGYIDAVIMLYSAPDYTSSPDVAQDSNCWWAFTYYDLNNPQPNLVSPNGNHFFWASIDFLYNWSGGRQYADAHTLIHETGHLLGVGDYYSMVDYSSPAGGWDMMDQNVIDHNSATKMAYGWVDPYVVDDSCTITIKPYQTSGDCIVLANFWNETAWDEYIMIELYTSDADTLSNHDTVNNYQYRGHAYGGCDWMGRPVSGVRMWHVDNRVGLGNQITSSGRLRFADWMSGEMLRGEEEVPSGYYWAVAYTNGGNQIMTGLDDAKIMRLISAKQNRFGSGRSATKEDLFQTGDEWELDVHDPAFTNGCFDSGEELNYYITFDSVTPEEATITFQFFG